MRGDSLRSLSANQRGFSLIELMIAVLLGLVITLAATQMFTVGQRTLQLQQATSTIQEEGQLTLRFLVDDIRMTGFYEDGVSGEVGVAFTGTNASSNGASGDNDRLTIAYHGVQDCTGNDVAGGADARVLNSYWVDDGTLKCTGNSGTGNSVSLLDNVQSFQVLYGIRGSEALPSVERYVPAASSLDPRQVLAVKVAFLLRNDSANLGEGSAQTIILLDEEIDIDAADTNAMHRMFYRTVALRNFPWDL